jgi:hypothetical protein
LRRNNPAHGVPPRQHDAAMIHFRHCVGQLFDQALALHNRASAGRAPVPLGFFAHHGMALAADSFHI